MRSQLLNTLTGALGLAALAASSPNPQHYGDPDSCVLSVSTVFVTVSQTTHTITLQQAPTSTVYVTLSASSAVEAGKVPTGTETRVNTFQATTTLTPQPETVYITVPSSPQIEGGVAASSSSSPYYETTVTHYTHVTVTEVYTGPITSTTTATGPLSFIANNGTTSWFNGQTPDSTVSLVVVTSVVIVVPVITPPSTATSTTTLKSTIFETHLVFLTEILSTKNSSSTSYYPVSVGTGVSFTGMASGGWNATSTAAGIASSTAGNDPTSARVASAETSFATYFVDPSPTISQVSFITSQSFDIYEPHTALSLTFLSAESGFTALPPQNAPTTTSSASTHVPLSTATSATVISSAPTLASPSSSPLGVSTSSLNSSSLLSPYSNSSSIARASWTSSALGVSTSVLNSFLGQSSSRTSYTNSTTSVALISSTSSALGVSTSASTSLLSSYSPPPSYANSTFAVGISSSSSASGTVTSGSASSLSPLSSYHSMKPHHTRSHHPSSPGLGVSSFTLISPPSSPFMSSSGSLVSSSTSALGFVTSLPSSSFSTVYASSQDPNSKSSTSTISILVSGSPSSSSSTVSILSSSSISVSTVAASTTSVSEASPTFPSPPAYASPTACGEVGDFTLTFDDIPPLSVSNQSAIGVEPEPIFNPYHQFEFSDGFTVGPPPIEPYVPSSPPLLVEFIPNFNINGTNPMAGPNTAEDGYSGDIGNGDHGLTGCFSFNIYGASFGCDSLGPPCDFTFTGYQLNKTSGLDQQVAIQDIAVPACKDLTNLKCQLVPVTLDNTFQDLDKVRINVTVAGSPKIWWMDDLRLSWTNNTCAAGLCRISTPIH